MQGLEQGDLTLGLMASAALPRNWGFSVPSLSACIDGRRGAKRGYLSVYVYCFLFISMHVLSNGPQGEGEEFGRKEALHIRLRQLELPSDLFHPRPHLAVCQPPQLAPLPAHITSTITGVTLG